MKYHIMRNGRRMARCRRVKSAYMSNWYCNELIKEVGPDTWVHVEQSDHVAKAPEEDDEGGTGE